jgi:hypothetical protein
MSDKSWAQLLFIAQGQRAEGMLLDLAVWVADRRLCGGRLDSGLWLVKLYQLGKLVLELLDLLVHLLSIVVL